MKFAIVINTYVRINKDIIDYFDHPTLLEKFEEQNTLHKTIESINKLNLDLDDELSVYVFSVAAHEDTSKDDEIREKTEKILKKSKFKYYIYTNTDIKEYRKKYNSEFFSTKGYSEIRNQGFLFSIMNNEDVIIQIDDDELLRENYIIKTKEILNNNPDKYLITAPYEKDGTIRILGEDELKSWKKSKSMDEDIVRLSKDNSLKESIFGFGGNMIIRKEYAEKMFYPLEIPRGEDFALLLASRLIYENGNEYAKIEPKNSMFKTYYCSEKDITIIHEPPYVPAEDFVFYVEKNLKRFILEWLMIKGQSAFTFEDLKKYSLYLYEMIGYEDFRAKIKEILNELKRKYQNIDKLEKEILGYFDKYSKINRFEEYKKKQKEYIELVKSL
ncbi:hypothetical protein [Marinitoga aeolica]|uniref:Glycosyl transferase family 2 n=1 Tax=Marinitoga aeolica TaxID=2809031 RepID=A0ABY8PPX9_9BACT|nr:hypothetical protein [Marinitoga aeolica]WGS64682.1 hypothetical protein JRV97_10000 [Marinitoga aeolica]